jgi:hypothetical protein
MDPSRALGQRPPQHVGNILADRRYGKGYTPLQVATASVTWSTADVLQIEASRSVSAADWVRYVEALRKLDQNS